MYKIRRYLLLVTVLSTHSVFGQEFEIGTETPFDRQARFAQRSTGTQPRPRVRRVNRGPASEPALPDSTSDPMPKSVADRPDNFSFRRRKLNLRQRQ